MEISLQDPKAQSQRCQDLPATDGRVAGAEIRRTQDKGWLAVGTLEELTQSAVPGLLTQALPFYELYSPSTLFPSKNPVNVHGYR